MMPSRTVTTTTLPSGPPIYIRQLLRAGAVLVVLSGGWSAGAFGAEHIEALQPRGNSVTILDERQQVDTCPEGDVRTQGAPLAVEHDDDPTVLEFKKVRPRICVPAGELPQSSAGLGTPIAANGNRGSVGSDNQVPMPRCSEMVDTAASGVSLASSVAPLPAYRVQDPCPASTANKETIGSTEGRDMITQSRGSGGQKNGQAPPAQADNNHIRMLSANK